MTRFAYARDGLFLGSVAAYALNRWLFKGFVRSPFMLGHFNDLFLIPAALPPVLWVQRWSRLRTGDGMPSWTEMGLHLAVWSLICELIGPFWLHHGTADPWDVAMYAFGGIAACLWWNRPFKRGS